MHRTKTLPLFFFYYLLCSNTHHNMEETISHYFHFIATLTIVVLSVCRGEQQQQWCMDEPWAEHADASHDAFTPPHLHRHERAQTPASWGELHGGVLHDPRSATAARTPSDPSATTPPNTLGLQVRALILQLNEFLVFVALSDVVQLITAMKYAWCVLLSVVWDWRGIVSCDVIVLQHTSHLDASTETAARGSGQTAAGESYELRQIKEQPSACHVRKLYTAFQFECTQKHVFYKYGAIGLPMLAVVEEQASWRMMKNPLWKMWWCHQKAELRISMKAWTLTPWILIW